MRLLRRASDGSLELTETIWNDRAPPYAVLSHTWLGENEEVLFDDIVHGNAWRKPSSYEKIRFCGERAAEHGLEFFWIDTCCIDKSSSADIQEAITAMFTWYRQSERCFVYMTDVSATLNETRKDFNLQPPWEAAFRQSRWFTRGWTLQELLAPRAVDFYSREGVYLGDKRSLEPWIHEITGIPVSALRNEPLSNFSVTERLAWAQNRQTSRKEDSAYCLLGIFGVFMPLMYGEGDHAFVRLQENINKPQRIDARHDDLIQALPTAPQAAFNSRDNEHGSTCLPQTRMELLQEIAEWVTGSDHRCLFWLYGMAGTGKSTIARTVARKYYDEGVLGGSFIFCKGGGEANRAEKLCTTLASQMANKIPAVRPYICDAISKNKDIASSSLRDQWEQLIMEPLSRLRGSSRSSRIVLVIDALDECDSEGDVRIILRFLSSIRKLQNVNLRIFVTSRPDTTIQSGLAHASANEHRAFVLHDILPTLIDRDLTVFFEENLTAIRLERGWSPDWPGAGVVRRLVDIACGLFIWASTACRYIRDGKQLAMKRISKLINGHRSGAAPQKQLDEIYITVLKDAIHQDFDEDEKEEMFERMKVVIGSIVVLFSPLSAKALANLLQKDANYTKETLMDLHTIFKSPTDETLPIRLHHPTFRDFLLDKDRCPDLNFWVDEKERHQDLADNCIELMSRTLVRDICNLHSPGTLAKDIDPHRIEQSMAPELRYACAYWVDHYRQAGTHFQDDDKVHVFLQNHFLHWLEAMSLIGELSQMPALIRMYQAMLPSAENQKQIPFIKDCRRFTFAFHTIIEQAPLQIYCAALVYIPPSNQLRHHFWHELHPFLKHIRVIAADAPIAKDEYNYVNDLSFTPDGKQIASGSLNEEVRIWYVAERATRCKFGGQVDKVGTVAFSPDGSMIASGSDDATVMIWDSETGAVVHHLKGHTRWVNAVVFSPDGTMIASGSMDETLRLWDTRSGKETHVLEDNSSYVNSVDFSPDGSIIASASADQMIRLWNTKRGEVHLLCEGHAGPVNSVRFSPSGARMVTGSDDRTVKIWDVAKGVAVMTLIGHSKKVGTVAFSKDGRQIASGSDDKTLKLWRTTSGELLRTLEGHTSGLNAVAYAPGGHLLASCSFNDEVRLWEPNTGEPHGKLADFEDQTPSLDTLARRQSQSFIETGSGHSSKIMHLEFSPDGEIVASSSMDSSIKLWSKDGEQRGALQGHTDTVTCLAFSPVADDHLLASASDDLNVKLWDSWIGTLNHTLHGHSGSVSSLKFSSNGDILASCSTDRTVIVWNTTTGSMINHFSGHEDIFNSAAFAVSKGLLLSGSRDMTVRLWRIFETGDVSESFIGHSGNVNCVNFSDDGELLLSGADDNTIRIWRKDGSQHGVLEGHTLPVISASFSHDGKLIVSCSEDRTIRVWNVATRSGQDVLQVNAMVTTVGFSHRGPPTETNRGPPVPDNTPTSQSSLSSRFANSIFASDQRLQKETEHILSIPSEFFAIRVAIWKDKIVIGHPTGSISFLSI